MKYNICVREGDVVVHQTNADIYSNLPESLQKHISEKYQNYVLEHFRDSLNSVVVSTLRPTWIERHGLDIYSIEVCWDTLSIQALQCVVVDWGKFFDILGIATTDTGVASVSAASKARYDAQWVVYYDDGWWVYNNDTIVDASNLSQVFDSMVDTVLQSVINLATDAQELGRVFDDLGILFDEYGNNTGFGV